MSSLGSSSEEDEDKCNAVSEKLKNTSVTECGENLKKVENDSFMQSMRLPGQKITSKGISGKSYQTPVWKLNKNLSKNVSTPLRCQFPVKNKNVTVRLDSYKDSCDQLEGEQSLKRKFVSVNSCKLPMSEPKREVRSDFHSAGTSKDTSEVISNLQPAKKHKLSVEEQNQILEPKGLNFPKNCENKIVSNIGKTVLHIHNKSLSAGIETIECWEDICKLPDGKYELFFNISRITMRKLLDLVKDINYDSIPYQIILSHMSIDQLISFSVRYLAKRNTVNNSFRLFNVPPGMYNFVLEKGFHLISKLRDVVIKKPDVDMWQETRNYNLSQYKIPSAGALGHKVFVNEKEEVLLAQVICNEKNMFAVVDVGSDLRISAALEKSEIFQDAINSLPDNCYFISSYEYKSYMQSNVKVLTPLIETDDWHLLDYNEALCKAHNVLQCFEETCKLFPRLYCLDIALPEAVLSATVLYNLSILCKDLSS